MFNLSVLLVAVVLLTEPNLSLFRQNVAKVAPLLSLDLLWSLPITEVIPNLQTNGPIEGLAILFTLCVPIFSAYSLILINISKYETWPTLSLWMGIGYLAGTIYCK